MANQESVSQWIEHLRRGDEEAAAQLWQRYFDRMVQAAQGRLHHFKLGVVDEEDVALSAFDSFCRGAAEGRFEELKNRHNLWALLLTITAQKAIDHIRREHRQRRGSGKVVRESELDESPHQTTLDDILSQGPTPEFLALMDEIYAKLMSHLRDDTLRAIVKWKLEAYENNEIAAFLGISVHTVGRKLRIIRLAWVQELMPLEQS